MMTLQKYCCEFDTAVTEVLGYGLPVSKFPIPVRLSPFWEMGVCPRALAGAFLSLAELV
jgi:hypothetical protein